MICLYKRQMRTEMKDCCQIPNSRARTELKIVHEPWLMNYSTRLSDKGIVANISLFCHYYNGRYSHEIHSLIPNWLNRHSLAWICYVHSWKPSPSNSSYTNKKKKFTLRQFLLWNCYFAKQTLASQLCKRFEKKLLVHLETLKINTYEQNKNSPLICTSGYLSIEEDELVA